MNKVSAFFVIGALVVVLSSVRDCEADVFEFCTYPEPGLGVYVPQKVIPSPPYSRGPSLVIPAECTPLKFDCSDYNSRTTICDPPKTVSFETTGRIIKHGKEFEELCEGLFYCCCVTMNQSGH